MATQFSQYSGKLNAKVTASHGLGISVALALSAIAANPAAAQSSAINPPTRDELTQPQARPQQRSNTTLTIDGQLQRGACALDNPDYADIRVTLSQVSFVGAERAAGISLAPAYQPYLGRDLPISVLCDIRSAANQILQNAGYLASVEIPEQRLSGGAAEFRVILGKLTAVRIRGEAGPSENLIASYLQKLVGRDVFNTKEAERYLLLADDLPGVDVRLTLQPAAGGQPGDLIGEIAVVRQRAAVDVNVQNFGSRAVGRYGGVIRAELYDLTGMGDRTSLALFSTLDFQEQQTVQLAQDFRVGSEGLMLGGQLTYSWANPDIGLAGFNIKSETLFATLQARYPFVRTQALSLFGSAGIDLVDQDVTSNGVPLTRDRVRMAFARLDGVITDAGSIARRGGYSPYEPKTRLSGSIEVRQGLDVLSSAPDCRTAPLTCLAAGAIPPSRIEADPTPLVVRLELSAEYRPVPLLAVVFDLELQHASSGLPAFEEFSGGNYSIGRGYDPGSVLGDDGYAAALELRYGSLMPKGRGRVAVQPYIYTDIVRTRNEDPSRRATNPDQLWSGGGGLRFVGASGIQGDLFVAVPFEKTDSQITKGDTRVLFTLSARLFPWRF